MSTTIIEVTMRRLVGLAVLLSACVGGFSCSSNPVQTALTATPENRPETVAFALHNSYVVLAERAATIAEDSTTPRTVKLALVAAHETASPVAKKLRAAAVAYRDVREAVAAGGSTPEKLANALAALNEAITNAAPAINAFALEVGGPQ